MRVWNRVVSPSEVAKIFAEDKGTGIGGGEIEIILGDIAEKDTAFHRIPNPARGGDKIFVKYRMTKASIFTFH
ncbi:MAG: hypothetical protein WDO15_29590 [Bacteroidota bacterium]